MPSNTGPATILSVDDTPANLIAMRAVLEPLGCPIQDARSGSEAIALARSAEFALVLLDVMMADMDGLETLTQLRSTDTARDTPVILVTACDVDHATLKRAYALGAVDYITKPVAPEVLRGKARALLALYEANRALRARDAALVAKDRQIAVLAHDLRNPLSTVSMALRLVLAENLSERARLVGERAVRAAGRMQTMVSDLLDHARIAGGALPITRVPTDLRTLSIELIEELQTADPSRAIELEVVGNVRGEWDPARVQQALSNLVSNATQYGDGRAHVVIDGRASGVEIAVHNEGPPIPSELMPVLFEPFERGRNDGTGLGLGLYIVRMIVDAHGGTVSVDSSREHGTTFRVRLSRTPGSGSGHRESAIAQCWTGEIVLTA